MDTRIIEKDTILKLYTENRPIEVADMLDINISTLYTILKKYGIPLKGRSTKHKAYKLETTKIIKNEA